MQPEAAQVLLRRFPLVDLSSQCSDSFDQNLKQHMGEEWELELGEKKSTSFGCR